jgi:hypothetical protein
MKEDGRSEKAIIPRLMRAASVIIGDLDLLLSLYAAHFIVWRTLRVRHKERVARLKSLKLISGGGQATGGHKAPLAVGMDEKGMLREAVRSNSFGYRG